MDFSKIGGKKEDDGAIFSLSMYDDEFIQLIVKALSEKSSKVILDDRFKDSHLIQANKTHRGITFNFLLSKKG